MQDTIAMLPGYLIATLIGLALGVLVNFLADRLPAQVVREDDDRRDMPVERLTHRQRASIARRRRVRSLHVVPARSRQKKYRPALLTGTPAHRVSASVLRIGVVEIVLAAGALYLWYREGPSLLFGIYLFYIALFVLIAVIDIEHLLVLNIVMVPAFILALLEILLSGRLRILDAMAGMAIAQLVLLAFYGIGEVYLYALNALSRGPEAKVALGGGDVTLAAFCGMLLGFPRVVPMLILMVAFGAISALLVLLYRLLAGRYRAHIAFPYGPSILLATTLLLLWGPAVARFFGAP